jgi:hypothetical protein
MRRIQLTTVLIFLACALGLAPLHAQTPPQELVPFNNFVRGVTTANPHVWLSRPESRVKTPEAFEEMRQHILMLYRGVHVPHSFLLDIQVFDCVPITEQPSVRFLRLKIATPPPPIQPPPTQARSPEPGPPVGGQPDEPQAGGNKVDVFGNAISCDQGTIPMRRITLEEMTRFGSLREFLGKELPGVPSPASPAITNSDHRHANAQQMVDNNGGGSWLNIWDPSLAGPNDFSVSQQWYIGGSGTTQQTVEGGWMKYAPSDPKSVLFIFYTPDGYTTKCYNMECLGSFVQTDNTWTLGGAFPNYSTLGGAQYEFQMVWEHTQGNWWLYLQRGGETLNPIGYYPDTIFKGGQLSKNAQYIYYGGETAPSASTGPWPPMGSGEFADQGYQYAAYQSVIHYFDLSGNSQWPTLTPVPDAPATCYTITSVPASSGGSWGAYIYFGGPGGNSC